MLKTFLKLVDKMEQTIICCCSERNFINILDNVINTFNFQDRHIRVCPEAM